MIGIKYNGVGCRKLAVYGRLNIKIIDCTTKRKWIVFTWSASQCAPTRYVVVRDDGLWNLFILRSISTTYGQLPQYSV